MKSEVNKMLGFKRKDPVCGMKEDKGEGISDAATGKWFCSENCRTSFKQHARQAEKAAGHGHSCCH